MIPNVSLAEGLVVAGVITPATTANTQRNTGAIDLAVWDSLLFVFSLGNMASETIDFKCYKCDSDGNNATALKSATQLSASASANDNGQVVIALNQSDLNVNSEGARYIKFGLVTGGATGGPAAVLALGVPVYGLASANDLSTVAEIKF